MLSITHRLRDTKSQERLTWVHMNICGKERNSINFMGGWWKGGMATERIRSKEDGSREHWERSLELEDILRTS